jgi:hypothetical protein
MSEFPLGYERIDPTTWVYLSSLLMIGLFFKFSRFWSVRNLDLILLILLAPGLLCVYYGDNPKGGLSARRAISRTSPTTNPTDAQRQSEPPIVQPTAASRSSGGENVLTAADGASGDLPVPAQHERSRALKRFGFIWLFCVGALFLVRLLLDPMMVRRPLLEPNLSAGGLTFIGCSMFVFLMANVINSMPTADDLEGPRRADQMMSGQAPKGLERHGPGYALVFMLPRIHTIATRPNEDEDFNNEPVKRVRTWTYQQSGSIQAEYMGLRGNGEAKLRKASGEIMYVDLELLSQEDRSYIRTLTAYSAVAKAMAILSHLAIVIGIVLIGYRHFDNIKTGIGAATIYLMLPYTAQMTGLVEHVLPGALLIWAVLSYRRPLAAGIFMGLAMGVIYYPLFLLPLWLSFYWQRGLMRFIIGVVSVLLLMIVPLAFTAADLPAFWAQLQQMFGLWLPVMDGLEGIWGLGWNPVYRIPILAAFFVLSVSFALWPAQKNLGTLLSCSAVVMVAAQFWHGFGGGLYMAWYLPLMLLTVFRPNLEDRVALTVLGIGWFPRRRHSQPSTIDRAA